MIESDKIKQAKKDQIRKEILVKLRLQDQLERITRSKDIKRRLFQESSFKSANSIMFYMAKSYEVDTKAMIDEALTIGKKVIIPVTDTQEKRLIPSEIKDPQTELIKGPFGIYEPKKETMNAVKTDDIEVVIVPGIAFDAKGNRIGHGEGYFDRFLKYLPKSTPTIGLGFIFQLVDKIDTLSWDIPVAKVITA